MGHAIEDLRVIVDTREQTPWTFPPSVRVVGRRKLIAGDYSPEGFECTVAIERKNIDDLVTSIIRDRDRFVRELKILSGFRFAAVIVEANLDQFMDHGYRSKVPARVVLKDIATITASMRVPVMFAGARANAATLAEMLMRAAISGDTDLSRFESPLGTPIAPVANIPPFG